MNNQAMQLTNILIRTIRLDDLPGAMRLSSQQGWNQTERDWKWMIEGNQNICLLAEYEGKIIATTTAINYSNEVVWISMVLVDKEYRGHGISKLLLKNILERLSTSRSIKLDATPEGQRVYQGFDFKDEYLITRMTLDVVNAATVEFNDAGVQRIQPEDISMIVALDTRSFGANRIELLTSLINTCPHKAWVVKQHNSVAGFVLGRAGRKYNQIGPVMASDTALAKVLITKSLIESENKPLVVDVLNDKVDLMRWLISIGFTPQRTFVRMYLNKNPFPGTIENQFLICGPEFG
jgi:GNAT superfamily N-acetyltransferase